MIEQKQFSAAEPAASATMVSALVVVDAGSTDVASLLSGYVEMLEGLGRPYELICLHDSAAEPVARVIADFAGAHERVRVAGLRPWPGEDGALRQGIARAEGALVLTLPSWAEITPASIPALIEGLGDADMVVGIRGTEGSTGWQRFRRGAVHWLVARLFGRRFKDVFCRARLGRADVFRSISDMGVRQHFMPVLAAQEGYRVVEVPVERAPHEGAYQFKPVGHLNALVDLLGLYVVLKFLRRPLRFFGAIGLPILALGLLLTFVLVVSRLFFAEPLADRPALVFGVMMIVLGVQVVALGLIGEIVIFSSSRRMKTFLVDRVVSSDPEAGDGKDENAKDGNAKNGGAT